MREVFGEYWDVEKNQRVAPQAWSRRLYCAEHREIAKARGIAECKKRGRRVKRKLEQRVELLEKQNQILRNIIEKEGLLCKAVYS